MDTYCNYDPSIAEIQDLTCEEFRLRECKELEFEEWIGGHKRISIFVCYKCKNYWKIHEMFDSHHGFSKVALKLDDSKNINNAQVEFKKNELDKLD